jgi:2-polyprenyl-3-methyl-5-hydroxy-6-metoxy-1,4-benzoquinol methylase
MTQKTHSQRLSGQQFYDDAYRKNNYFAHNSLLYRPFVKSLISAAGLKRGSEILDAGCGQGFFSHLLAAEGMTVYGTDMSVVGLKKAKELCDGQAARFFASDLNCLPSAHKFDCVFVRSCSLFNTDRLEHCVVPMSRLLAMVKSTGLLIFVYNTNLNAVSGKWRHHRLEDIRSLLERSCPAVDLYFINKVDTLLFRRWAFNKVLTRINAFIAGRTGYGGEAVALCRMH